ncbi:MAG: ATP-dependent helicase [Candidatus Melainabacteria bacterium HGW-Melainabacteria-1]|nr:MAG: ATP-dependent helicase [Candidatus Melainabacteria bacterium HGW-Melainabacteria-1]
MAQLLLTPEQQQVVAHNHGPALVFAVAGAGKTTAMVHRIARLVREAVYAPRRILATSFSRATVADIKAALAQQSHCQEVQVATLHSIGLQILRRAQDLGVIPRFELGGDEGAASEKLVLKRALGRARQQRLELPPNLDEQDFLSYVGVCKGNFKYPNPEQLQLPSAAMALVSQAESPEHLPVYAELYDLFEQTRVEMGLITFDDMLLSAWEALQRSERLLQEKQNLYDCVLVDEFQDVNAVQNELLDLLTARHRNYMAIGDDDQTIYEWRGASPRFILEFPARYGAVKYLLRENFRSRASHLALANSVIRHNLQREPKQLLLTRGFEGHTKVQSVADERAQARQLVIDIMGACQAGYNMDQQAILLRLYAQTPWIEQALIASLVPYRIVGSVPFYQRSEIRTLLAYLDLGRCERQLRRGTPLTGSQLEGFHRRWLSLANRPVRYLSRQWLEWVFERIRAGHGLVETLEALAQNTDTAYQSKLVRVLAGILSWLADEGLDGDAGETLTRLEAELRYCQYLRKSSGFPETGEGRALTVEAFLDYCRTLGGIPQLESHLDQLAADQRSEPNCLTLTTIFRAKGLEWPVVYVPHCNQGYFPYASAHSLEEERRLFYVAVTRPREQLNLYVLQNLPLSRFLAEASWQQILEQVQQTRRLLERSMEHWSPEEFQVLAVNSSSLLLQRFFEHWWQAPAELRRRLMLKISSLSALQPLDSQAEALYGRLAASDLPPPAQAIAAAALISQPAPTPTALPYAIGEAVWSERYGHGTVLACETHARQGALLEVSFADGPQKLLAKYADLRKA